MEKSFGFYVVVTSILVPVGLLVLLAIAGKWVAVISVATLVPLLLLFLSNMLKEQRGKFGHKNL